MSSPADAITEQIQERLAERGPKLLVNSDGSCAVCKGTHDPFDFDACDRVMYPKMSALRDSARHSSDLANKAAKRRGGPIRL